MAVAADSDTFAQVRGFKVEIANAGGKEVDTAWETVSGGALMIEHVETTIGSDKFHTHAPGHKSIEEITLRGAMTDKRAALCQWINDTVSGKAWKRTVTITPLVVAADGTVSDGPASVFEGCFPARYAFPRLDLTDPSAAVPEEEVTFVYERLTVVPAPH